MEKKNKKQNRVKDIKIVNKSGTTVLKHFTENLFLLKVFGVRTTANKEKPKKAQELYNKFKKSGYELYLLDDEMMNEIKNGFDLIYKINN